MQRLIAALNGFFEQAPARLLPWRYWVLVVFLCSTGYMTYLMMTRFQMDMSLESWFQSDDPAKVSLDRFRKTFGSDDGVYLVYEAHDKDVFSETSIITLKTLITELEQARSNPLDSHSPKASQSQLSRIQRIDSLYNARYQLATGDTLISRKLLSDDFPNTSKEREARREIALSQDSFKLAYFSKDYRFGGIRLKTDFGTQIIQPEAQQDNSPQVDFLLEDDFIVEGALTTDINQISNDIVYQPMQMDEYLSFMEDLRAITGQAKYQHFSFYYTGNAPMMEFAMHSMGQAGTLMGIMVLIVMLLLWFLFKSLSAVIWPILVVIASAFWSIGLASLLGVTLSNMVTLTFMLIFAVGIADCVHVLSAYISNRHENMNHFDAMSYAYRKTGVPIFLTSVTTMCGMLALTVSDIPQISVFAITSAIGVMMAFSLTVFILPVLLDIWHPITEKQFNSHSKNKKHWLAPLLNNIPSWVRSRSKLIVASYLGIFLLFLFGTSQVKVDSNFAELTKEGSTIRVTYELVDTHMMGGQNLEIMMSFSKENALKDPRVLKAVASLQKQIERQYSEYVVKTFSLADFVKETHMVMNEGRKEFKTIPDDPLLSAQLLYLFDSANSEDRRILVSDDYTQSHISIQLRNAGSYEYTEFFNDVRKDINDHFFQIENIYPELDINVTGSLALMMELIDHISWTQIKSFSFALLIITLLMMVTLGSFQGGLISMLPNLLPAFFTFGLLGLLGIPLDTDTLIIAPLIIGIAVDDTIHFLAHYRDAWYESGDVEKALANTIQEVGQAVTFTTLILGLGFSMLAFSDYLGMAKTGIFGSLAIFVALSSDLLLLPALIQLIKPDLGRKKFINKTQCANEQSGAVK